MIVARIIQFFCFWRKTAAHAVSAECGVFTIVQPKAATWEAGDVMNLRAFYQSTTGVKLVDICRSEVLANALKECHGDVTGARAAGGDELLRFQFNLASDAMLQKISRPTGVQVGKNTAPGQSEPAAETLRSF